MEIILAVSRTARPPRIPGRLAAALRDHYGLPGSPGARAFIIVAFVDAFGRGFFLAGSTLFYTQVIKLSVTQVGVGLSVAGLAGVICAVPVGRAADRFGSNRVLIVLQLFRAAAFIAYPFASSFGLFLVIASCVGAGEWAIGPIIQSVATSTASGTSLVGAMALVAVARNVAYALSAAIAAAAITLGDSRIYTGFVLANAAALLASAALVTRLRLRPRAQAAPRRAERPQSWLLPFRNTSFLLLSLANGILYLHATLLSVTMPLWIVTHTAAPRGLVGVVLLVNTALAVAFQVRLSRGGDDIRDAGRKQRRAGEALAFFSILMAVSGSAPALVASLLLLLAVTALTLGEMWQSAGGWGISYTLSPGEQRTYYLSVYQLGATGMAVAGPVLLSAAVIDQGPIGWLALAAVFVLTGLAVPLIARAPREASAHLDTAKSPDAPTSPA
jgi:MFS family permease